MSEHSRAIKEGDWIVFGHTGAWENGGQVLRVERLSIFIETFDNKYLHVTLANNALKICRDEVDARNIPLGVLDCRPGTEFLCDTIEYPLALESYA